MSDWREPEWRMPRRGDVVKDPEGVLGRVLKSEGTLQKRRLWVENVEGTEIYSNEEAENFQLTGQETTNDFHRRRFERMGYILGALCCFKGNPNVPLEILQMDWNGLRSRMTICLRDLRHFESEIMKTEDENLIPLFETNYPPLENIFSDYDSGLKYRLEVNLVEVAHKGWTHCGSPWEFFEMKDALSEVEAWKNRLKVRRVASVLAGEWKIKFPAWTIETISRDGKILSRAVEVKAFNGSPGYFETALHASLAVKILGSGIWHSALSSSHDGLNL